MSLTPEIEREIKGVHNIVEKVDSVESAIDSPTFPEGGWRAWSVVFGVWITQFCAIGYNNAHGVYNDYYVREYLDGYSSSQIGWIGSIQLLFTISAGIFTGRAFDVGYFYHLMIGGSFLFVFCLFMLSLTQPGQFYQVFLTQGVGIGIAAGATYVPGLAVISHYFHRRRALAMGIATTGSGIGGALHSIMLNKLINGSTGFHTGVRANAGLCLGLLFIALLLMKPRLPPTSRKNGSIMHDVRTFLSEPAYAATSAAIFLLLTGIFFPFFFIQLKAIKIGLAPNFAFYTLVILNGSSIIGRTVPNSLAPRFGVFNIFIFSMIALSILNFCLLGVKDVPGTVIFAILYGIFAGVYGGLLGPMVASLAKTDFEVGARIGLCFCITGFGALIGTPIGGALLTASFFWWRPLIFSGLCILVGAVFLCVARHVVSKEKGTRWV